MGEESNSHIIDLISKKKDNERIDQIHEYNLDVETNQIYLMGEVAYIGHESAEEGMGEPGVEFAMSNRFIKNLNILMRKSDKPILIHMKTCGGDWNEGMAIYDAIQACPNPTTIINYTHARSMSSLIFQAANKRVMMPHSYFLIHDGASAYGGTVKQFMSFADWYKTQSPVMINIYVDRMVELGTMKGKKKEEIYKWLTTQMNEKEDVYWSAKKTVQMGLADEIFGHDGKYNWAKLLKYTKEQLTR